MKYLTMKKKKNFNLFCDTNIWYNIATNGSSILRNNNNNVFVTYINIDELSITPNLLKDFEFVQKAIISMFKHYEKAVIENPIEYLIKLDNPHYTTEYYKEHYDEILKFTEDIANKKGIINEEVVRPAIEKRRKELNSTASEINERIEVIRKNVKENLKKKVISKDSYWKLNTIELTKETIFALVTSMSNNNYKLSPSFPWGKIELFLYTIDYIFKYLALSKKKWKANDWYHVFNLVYIQPKDQYLTNDDHVNNMIKGADMSKYLFE